MSKWAKRNETKKICHVCVCACVRARVCVCERRICLVGWLVASVLSIVFSWTNVGWKGNYVQNYHSGDCHMWPGPSVSCWTLAFTQTNKLSVPRAGLISQTVGIPWFHEEVGSTLSSKTTKLRDKSQECATAYNMMLAVWRNVSLTLD